MISALAIALIIIFSALGGAILLFAYMLKRIMGNKGFDDSNITNPLRVLIHVVLHKNDFGKMYYLDELHINVLEDAGLAVPKRPFWYISKDELSEVVATRPRR